MGSNKHDPVRNFLSLQKLFVIKVFVNIISNKRNLLIKYAECQILIETLLNVYLMNDS